MTLAQLPRTHSAGVVAVDGRRDLAQRLLAMGFLPGASVSVVNVAPLGDPITVEIDGWRVSMRRRDATCVEIDPVSESTGP